MMNTRNRVCSEFTYTSPQPQKSQHGHQHPDAPPLPHIQENLLYAERQGGSKHDPRKPFDQVVDRVKNLPGSQGYTHACRLQGKFGALHCRDHSVQCPRQGERNQSALEKLLVICLRQAVDRSYR